MKIRFGLCLLFLLALGFHFDIQPLLEKNKQASVVSEKPSSNSILRVALNEKSEDMSFFILQSAQDVGLTLREFQHLEKNGNAKQLRLNLLGGFKQICLWLLKLYSVMPIKVDDLNFTVENDGTNTINIVLTYLDYTYRTPKLKDYAFLADPFIPWILKQACFLQDEISTPILGKGYFCIGKVCQPFLQP